VPERAFVKKGGGYLIQDIIFNHGNQGIITHHIGTATTHKQAKTIKIIDYYKSMVTYHPI
jgi:hypothetical protein